MMQVLKMKDYSAVVGGNDTDTTKQLKQTAELAMTVCGSGNVSSVSTTSFNCK